MDLDTGATGLDDRCLAIFGVLRGTPVRLRDVPGARPPGRFARAVDAAVHHAVIWQGQRQVRPRIPHHRQGRRAGERWIPFEPRSCSSTGSNGCPIDRHGPGRRRSRGPARPDLRAAKELAESANHAKDEFLAMLGHELRNPLAPMLTAVELLRVRLGEAGARERDVIQRQVRNLAQLVDDMLDVAQIRKGKMAIAKESIYARQVVAKALELVTPMLEERRHRLEVEIEPPSLVIVGTSGAWSRRSPISSRNAVKYNPGGSIRVAVGDDGTEIVLRVSDTGRGMSADFLRARSTSSCRASGRPTAARAVLGLGLPIVRFDRRATSAALCRHQRGRRPGQ
jgi:signal transduction histidine kinase